MTFAVDDADPAFEYSANGWAIQSDNDPDSSQFFQGTYHVATADGATMSFQFQGSAFTLYGSKGPGHAKFQIQFDSTVVNLDASTPMTGFRQELFSHTFSNDTSQSHLVKLTAVLSGDGVKGKWLDVDYITFTDGSGQTTTIGPATAVPPWLTESAQETQSAPSSPSGPSGFTTPSGSSSSTSSSSSNKVPTILAALFGVIIGIALIAIAVYLVFRRIHDSHRKRERAFRYGQSSVNPASSPGYSQSSAASAKGSGGGGGGVASTFSRSLSPPSGPAGTFRDNASSPYSQLAGGGGTARDNTLSPSLASNVIEMRGMSSSFDVYPPSSQPREGAGTPTTSRPLVSSSSPIAWTRQKVAGGHKGDADSLRTDFLQV